MPNFLNLRIEIACHLNHRIAAYKDNKWRLNYVDRIMSLGKFFLYFFEIYNVRVLFKLLYTHEKFSYEDLDTTKSHSTHVVECLIKIFPSASLYHG